ncbi:MAG: recombinase family protein [Chloroflexota bacterium]
MADLTFFQDEFNRHASDGVLGDPQGKPGYAYLRVSTSAQAEEGRSGLPRQIARVHEIAAQSEIRISWDMVFADDHTGFEFTGRPELSRLRAEYTRPDRRANIVVIEYLDRLSRNSDWHQGYLLDEMRQHQIETLFWKGFSSRIERAVMGAVSQDGMERSLEIMREGMRDKARSGRVTSRVPAYGFMLVDADGNPSSKARQETYYAPHPEHAEIMQLIYYKIGVEGLGTFVLCKYLEERFPPPGRYKYWLPAAIRRLVRSPLYKGEYYHDRTTTILVPAKNQRLGEPTRMIKKKVERPREEWILVPVPPIVSVELWEAANAMLDKHAQMARRNGRVPYLLTGLVQCDSCGYGYSGKRQKKYLKDAEDNKPDFIRLYACNRSCPKSHHWKQEHQCGQSSMTADLLEKSVWIAVCEFMTKPESLIEQIDARLSDKGQAALRKQIAFLEQQIADSTHEDEKLYRAFMADVFDETEYAARRKSLKEKVATLKQERNSLSERVLSPEQVEADKTKILEFAAYVQDAGISEDASFEFKQRILKLLVDRIILNVKEGWFRINGNISGVWQIKERESDVSSPLPIASPAQAEREPIENTSARSGPS